MTGALLLSGLPCGEYGGGASPGATKLGSGAKPGDGPAGRKAVLSYFDQILMPHTHTTANMIVYISDSPVVMKKVETFPKDLLSKMHSNIPFIHPYCD